MLRIMSTFDKIDPIPGELGRVVGHAAPVKTLPKHRAVPQTGLPAGVTVGADGKWIFDPAGSANKPAVKAEEAARHPAYEGLEEKKAGQGSDGGFKIGDWVMMYNWKDKTSKTWEFYGDRLMRVVGILSNGILQLDGAGVDKAHTRLTPCFARKVEVRRALYGTIQRGCAFTVLSSKGDEERGWSHDCLCENGERFDSIYGRLDNFSVPA